MNNNFMFGERLKLARKRAGLSLRDLSEVIQYDVSAQAIGKYERGEMLPGSAIAIKLAKALRVSLSYLFSVSGAQLAEVEFRKISAAKAKEKSLVEALVLDHVDRYLSVEELLGISSHEWDKPKGLPFIATSLEEAEEVAIKLRKLWNLGGDPIRNITELLEEHGIKVMKLDFPLSVDGLNCHVIRNNKEKTPVIVGTDKKSAERRRFTLAHELGHMILEVSKGLDEEQACHRFASAFLMPREALLRAIGERRHNFGYIEIIEIKRLFGVSAAALIKRLSDLNIITKGTSQKIYRGIGKAWRKAEPAPLNHNEQPKRFERLVSRALAEDIISLPKAAELLQKKTSEVQCIMAGPVE